MSAPISLRPALLALAIAVVAGLLTPVLSLAPFSFGFWERAEPTVAWLHFAAALTAAALIWHGIRDGRVRAVLAHPFVLLPGLLLVWSSLTAVFAEFPLVALLGPPQSGQGALWYFDFAVFIAGGIVLSWYREAWLSIVFAGGLIGLTVGVLVGLSGRFPVFALLPVPEFYAYAGLALIFAGASLDPGELWRPSLLAAWGGALALLVSAGNLTAWILAGFVVAAAIGHQIASPRVRGWLGARGTGMVLAVTGSVVPFAVARWWPGLDQIRSLQSRQLIWDIMFDPANWSWHAVFVGHGWGHTQETFLAHLNAARVHLWESDWDFLRRDIFHSHNELLEAAHATGLVGAVLTLLMILALPLWADPARRFQATLFAVALGAMNTLWFQLAMTLPFVALAYAAFAGPLSETAAERPLAARVRQALLAVGVPVCLVAAAGLVAHGIAFGQAKTALLSPDRAEPPAIPVDFRGQELALAATVRILTDDPASPLKGAGSGAAATARHVVETLRQRIARDPSLLLTLAGVSFLSAANYTRAFPWRDPEIPYATAPWEDWLDDILEKAPGRTDVALPYMAWLLGRGRHDELAGLVERILGHDRFDPLGLFYGGTLLSTRAASRDLGLRFVGMALDHGVDRFLPVREWLRRVTAGLPPVGDPPAAFVAAWRGRSG